MGAFIATAQLHVRGERHGKVICRAAPSPRAAFGWRGSHAHRGRTVAVAPRVIDDDSDTRVHAPNGCVASAFNIHRLIAARLSTSPATDARSQGARLLHSRSNHSKYEIGINEIVLPLCLPNGIAISSVKPFRPFAANADDDADVDPTARSFDATNRLQCRTSRITYSIALHHRRHFRFDFIRCCCPRQNTRSSANAWQSRLLPRNNSANVSPHRSHLFADLFLPFC